MTEREKQQSVYQALMESATRLDFAWIEFSEFLDRFAFRALRMHPANDENLVKENPERYAQLNLGWLPRTWEARKKKLELRTHDERANLLYNIYYDDLWALGYRTLDDGSDELVRVPRQHFFVDYDREDPFPAIDWTKGELRVGDKSYFDIHIVRPPKMDMASEQADHDEPEELPNNQDPKFRRGRPKTSQRIATMVEDLWLTDRDFRSLPNRTSQAEEVRARLCGEEARLDHQRVGFNTSSIVKIIGRVAGRLDRPE